MIASQIQKEIRSILSTVDPLFDRDIEAIQPLQGGDINAVYKIKIKNKFFVVKINYSSRYPDMFKKEKEGLNELSQANCIDTPKVFGYGEADNQNFLILEYIEPYPPANNFWAEFGQSLANLHQVSNNKFGFIEDNYIGSLVQDNRAALNWDEFFIERRLKPMLKKAQSKRHIDSDFMDRFENLYKNIPNLFPKENSSLLHGDLWSGNFMSGKNGAVVYDPAVYYGYREMDIAMTVLFGGFNPEFYDSYNEVFPLQVGWRERVELCNLYPLLVHLNLFGLSYYNPIKEVLLKYT